jgi:hypothetical protein
MFVWDLVLKNNGPWGKETGNTLFTVTSVLIMLMCVLFWESVGCSPWNTTPFLPTFFTCCFPLSLRTLCYPDGCLLWLFFQSLQSNINRLHFLITNHINIFFTDLFHFRRYRFWNSEIVVITPCFWGLTPEVIKGKETSGEGEKGKGKGHPITVTKGPEE